MTTPKVQRPKFTLRHGIILGVGVLVLLGIALRAFGVNGNGGSGGGQSLTYVVTGSGADVTYGPAGSSLAGSAPMTETATLGSASYYFLSAQLQGSGQVGCKILIAGNVISQASASAAYGIASCEITKDIVTGQWQNANGG